MVALVWGKAATVRSTETVSKVGVLPRRGVTLRSKGDPHSPAPTLVACGDGTAFGPEIIAGVLQIPWAFGEGVQFFLSGGGVLGPVDLLQRHCDSLAVLVGNEVQRIADQVNDAGLDLGLWKHRGDRLRKALQTIDDGDEDVFDAAVLQLVHDAQPEFCALGLLDPQAENFLGSVGPNPEGRRAVRARGHFPTDESALKLLFLVLNLAQKEWRMPPREWAMVTQGAQGHDGDQAPRDWPIAPAPRYQTKPQR
jgi:hypothetical protein